MAIPDFPFLGLTPDQRKARNADPDVTARRAAKRSANTAANAAQYGSASDSRGGQATPVKPTHGVGGGVTSPLAGIAKLKRKLQGN